MAAIKIIFEGVLEIKYCPYCLKRLPFFNLVWQRLTFSENKALVCRNCASVISTQGDASIWVAFACGGGCGSVLGHILSPLSLKALAISGAVGFLVLAVMAYITAPVRDSE